MNGNCEFEEDTVTIAPELTGIVTHTPIQKQIDSWQKTSIDGNAVFNIDTDDITKEGTYVLTILYTTVEKIAPANFHWYKYDMTQQHVTTLGTDTISYPTKVMPATKLQLVQGTNVDVWAFNWSDDGIAGETGDYVLLDDTSTRQWSRRDRT